MDFRNLGAAVAVACVFASPASAADLKVNMGYGLFKPAQATVARGTRIVFSNDDTHAHKVSSTTRGHGFNLGELKPGVAKAHVFTRPGTIKVICGYHPGMEMTVTVR